MGLDAAWAAFARADWASARSLFAEALEVSPDDPEALDGLGQSLWWLTDREGAIAHARARGRDRVRRPWRGALRDGRRRMELGPAAPYVAWVREPSGALAPSASGGGYVNEIGDQPACTGYSDAAWERLVRVKQRWDPQNVFRLNANVPPAR